MNGRYSVAIRTIYGSFNFKTFRLKKRSTSDKNLGKPLSDTPFTRKEKAKNLFDEMGFFREHFYTVKLAEKCLALVKEVSYRKAKTLLKDLCEIDISTKEISRMVKHQANTIVCTQKKQIANFEENQMISKDKVLTKKVDIYDKNSLETIFLCDDVCVKQQKTTRNKQLVIDDSLFGESNIAQNTQNLPSNVKNTETTPPTKHKTKFFFQRVSLLQTTQKDTYKTIVAGIGVDNTQFVKSCIWTEYGKNTCLPIVAITDGATSIKNELYALFGDNFVHILDWYHLEHKVHQMMSMISHKVDKECHVKNILEYLWKGKIQQTITYLEGIEAKNPQQKVILLTYLNRKSASIINYEERKNAGKVIGSGRVEKYNDLLVAKRQKYKGCAWTPQGSSDMTIINT